MRHVFSPGLPNQESHPVLHLAGDSSVSKQSTIAGGHTPYFSGRHPGFIDRFEKQKLRCFVNIS